MLTEVSFVNRAYTDEDLQAVTDFVNYCSDVENLEDNYSADELKNEFEHPKLDKELDLRLWHNSNGELVGFGQIWRSNTEERFDANLYFRVHPEVKQTGLSQEVLQWAETRVKLDENFQKLPTFIYTGNKSTDELKKATLEQAGYEVARYFYTMERDLNMPIPAYQLPEGFKLDYVKTPEEVAEWVNAFNMSFIDHWNHHPTTVEEHSHWLNSPDFVPELDLVAVAPDGKFAAFCFCTIHKMENAHRGVKEGWIGMLGSVRNYRKLGFGKNMLLAGMQKLKDYGMDTAMLGVDSVNPSGAVGLYDSVGFKVRRTNVSYRKTLN
jgi:mycothiol synthase